MRLSFLCVILFSYISLCGMHNSGVGAGPREQGIIETILRDAATGGLIKPALAGMGSHVMIKCYNGQQIVPDITTLNFAKTLLLGSLIIGFPVLIKCISSVFDVKQGAFRTPAYYCRDAVRLGYGIMACYLMSNTVDVMNFLLSI